MGQNAECQNVETDKMSNGTKRRRDIMSKVIKAERDKTSNGTNCRTEITSNETICRLGQNVECQNVKWDKMSKNSILCRSCPCPRPRPCVPVPVSVHLPMSTSTCPCVPVRGHGQISPVKFSRIYYMCT
jgi:hypothetical protein